MSDKEFELSVFDTMALSKLRLQKAADQQKQNQTKPPTKKKAPGAVAKAYSKGAGRKRFKKRFRK